MTINNYNLQYWLYAVFNKKYGKQAKIARDELHSKYDVNRHGIILYVNTHEREVVKKTFEEYLKSCGYIFSDGWFYEKTIVQENGIEKKLIISIKDAVYLNKEAIYIFSVVYKK